MSELSQIRKANREFQKFCMQFSKVYAEYERLVLTPKKNPYVSFEQFVNVLFQLGITQLKKMNFQQVQNFVENKKL